jgi:benzoate membrane transport protein
LTALTLAWPKPEFVWPSFSVTTLIGVGVPLFLVTMASQNLPGVAVMRAHGYDTPVSPVLGWTGLTGVLLGPFGGFSFNFAAITAAICMSPETDPDPKRRYLAAVWTGIFYLIMGALGATVVGLFAAFPQALVLSIAGLALFSTIGNSLADSVANPKGREAAMITFLVTASGLSLFGIGAAFWGLLAGLFTNALLE